MIHERTHKSPELTFSCEVCGRGFKRQDNLKQHRYVLFASNYCMYIQCVKISDNFNIHSTNNHQ